MADNKDQEPSIEEILASIRQIISDDDGQADDSVKKDDKVEKKELEEEKQSEPEAEPNEVAGQDDIDAMFDSPADVAEPEPEPEPEPEVNEVAGQDDIDAMFDSPAQEDNEEDDDILDLVDPVEEENEIVAEVEPEPEIESQPQPEPEPEPQPESDLEKDEEKERVPLDIPEGDSIFTQNAAAATDAGFSNLLDNIAVSKVEGITLEDIVKEMLRPMLREWIDSNLPDMIERLVQEELEKLSKRR